MVMIQQVKRSPDTVKEPKLTKVNKRHAEETLAGITRAVDPSKLTPLSNKSLMEVTQLQEEIAQMVPAGNTVGLIIHSLTQLKDRVVPPDRAKTDIETLMRSLGFVQDVAFNTAVFASPAAVLAGYQKILALTGKDIHSAFPDGLWQFYLEFSMREDTAHHTNETIGFHKSLKAHQRQLPLYDQLSAWVLAAVNLYFQYDDLLMADWSERTYLNLLEDAAEMAKRGNDPFFRDLKKKWMRQKPFQCHADARANESYLEYRRRRFQRFYEPRLQSLSLDLQATVEADYLTSLRAEAYGYQQQLSILATLDPMQYREVRRSIPLWQAHIAVIWHNEYHLIPACAIDDANRILCFDLKGPKQQPVSLEINSDGMLTHPRFGAVSVSRNGLVEAVSTARHIGRLRPISPHHVQNWVWAIINGQFATNVKAAEFDLELLCTPRNEHEKLRQKLNSEDIINLGLLKRAPVIINWDQQDRNKPLADIRQGRRGVGDHALTIFRTEDSLVFDQSHIFFDGVWGLSLVEILTNEATLWASYLMSSQSSNRADTHSIVPDRTTICVVHEAAAESHKADLQAMMALRKNLIERASLIQFTVNDLLILYRCLFNQEYYPSVPLVKALDKLAQTHPNHADAIRIAFQYLPEVNPSLLIPVDAIDGKPKDRLYPVSFRNPSVEILNLLHETYRALETHRYQRNSRTWPQFCKLRDQLIEKLTFFGQLTQRHKKLAINGQAPNQATLKLMGHLPEAFQNLLDKIPQKFDFLNEMLKGEEVFSNMGRVPPGTSPARFMSATDDNDAKTLVWGILTDDTDRLYISMRDFRPEVLALFEIDQANLAQMIAQDFLNGYVSNLNAFTYKLNEIAAATIEGTA